MQPPREVSEIAAVRSFADLQPANHQAAAFRLLVEIDMEIGVFGSSWAHCDRLSTYVARMVSHNRTDSLLYSNLFSSALNELLETVFRAHRGDGAFACSVWRDGRVDRIELVVPCDADQESFYRNAVEHVGSSEAGERYRKALFSTGPMDPDIGLLELTVDYAAKLSVGPAGDGAIRLIADLALEEAQD